MVPVPCHIYGNHWVLGIAYFRTNRLEYLDILQGNGESVIPVILQYLKDEWSHGFFKPNGKPREGVFNQNKDWVVVRRTDIPIQFNNIDCGIFVCAYMYYTIIGKPFDLSAKDMDVFRKFILLLYVLYQGR